MLWLEAKAIYLLSEQRTAKMTNSAAYMLLFTSSICQNHFFFRSFNRNLWQAHTDDFHINSAFSSFIVSPTSLYRSGGTLVLLFIRHLSPGHFPRTRPSLFCLRCFEALPSVPCKDQQGKNHSLQTTIWWFLERWNHTDPEQLSRNTISFQS